MQKVKFANVFEDVTKYGTKISKENYLKDGNFPIIDQGQNEVAGYINEKNGIFEDVPVIVFGDHTRILKYVTTPFFLGADGVKVLKPISKKFDYKFLYYVLLNANIPDTGYNRHFKWLKEVIIPLPPIEEQKAIAERLDLLSELIDKRKEQIKKLDLLIKSRFIEMFGGFDLNYKNSQWRKIGDFGEVVGGSTPKTDKNEFWSGSLLWITPAEMDENSFIIKKTERTITEEGVKSCSLRILPKGTVLLTSRAPIGKVGIAGVEMYCNQGFKNIICGAKLQPVYMYFLLKYNVNYLNSLGRGATFKEISKTIVENILIPVPPIELQNQFAAFVEKTDKVKQTIKTNLEKLEILKKSLMQQYFG